MHFEADLIILDEPTVALSLKEVRKVLNFVHKIKDRAGRASTSPMIFRTSMKFGSICRDGPRRDCCKHREKGHISSSPR